MLYPYIFPEISFFGFVGLVCVQKLDFLFSMKNGLRYIAVLNSLIKMCMFCFFSSNMPGTKTDFQIRTIAVTG